MGRWILLVCLFVATSALTTMLLGRAAKPSSATFDEITVHRINVVEPDGTLRMIISNHSSFPGLITRGRERPYPRPFAGMLFYNNEGSEQGGLVFGGHMNGRGQVVDSGGSLSFDKYGEASQIVQLAGVADVHDRFAGLAVRGYTSKGVSSQRVWVGRDGSGTASVALMDAQGRKRIVMQVLKDGTASLSFLNGQGKIVKQITPK
ncbi:MAG: hypothetical protein ACRD2B_15670 [Terriglobia bacterium]